MAATERVCLTEEGRISSPLLVHVAHLGEVYIRVGDGSFASHLGEYRRVETVFWSSSASSPSGLAASSSGPLSLIPNLPCTVPVIDTISPADFHLTLCRPLLRLPSFGIHP